MPRLGIGRNFYFLAVIATRRSETEHHYAVTGNHANQPNHYFRQVVDSCVAKSRCRGLSNDMEFSKPLANIITKCESIIFGYENLSPLSFSAGNNVRKIFL